MKVTVENDKGERKEFECDGLAFVAQNGTETNSLIEGGCNAAQWACICVTLDEMKGKIVNSNPMIDAVVRLHGIDLDGIIERSKKDDES